MKDDDIEILDLDEEIIYTKKEIRVEKKVLINDDFISKTSLQKEEIREIKNKANEIKQNNKKVTIDNKKNKKEKRKYSKFEKIVLVSSIIFILGCFIFYGYRAYYYYHKSHDVVKSITLKDKLTDLGNIAYQNDGLYEKEGYFYYKGMDVNNYVYYSGRLFRIIDIDTDIRMIEDNTETNLVWGIDTDYDKSNIRKWLTSYVETLKDYDMFLVKNNFCNERIDIEKYDCSEMIDDYVGLLSVSDYLQAGAKNSYLNNETFFWTVNQDMEGNPLYVNNEGSINNIFKKDDNFFSYGIRPVIKIKGDTSIISGDGSKNSPFILEDLGSAMLRDNSIGSFVTYKELNFRILNVDDKGVTLIYDGILDVNKKYNDVYNYLNNEFIKKLDKKDLVKNNYGVNEYSLNYKYELFNKKTLSNYVIIPSVGDLFLNEYNNYWLNDYSNSKLGLYYTLDDNNMFFSDLKGSTHKIRPIIKLNSETIVISGTGTKNDPLIIGSEEEKDA